MQLHEVDEVKELFSLKDVNEALRQGWRIVAVVSSVTPYATQGDGPVACYVLGKSAKADPLSGLSLGAHANQP